VDFTVTKNQDHRKEMVIYLHEGCYDKDNQKWDDKQGTHTYTALLKWNKEEKEVLRKKERDNRIIHKKKLKFAEIAMYFLQQNWAYILTGDSSSWDRICKSKQQGKEVNFSQQIDESVSWDVQSRYSEICYERYPKTYAKLMRVMNLDINRSSNKGNSFAPYSGLYFSFHNFKLAFFNYLMDHKKYCDKDSSCSQERAVYSLMRSSDIGQKKIGMNMAKIMDLWKKMDTSIP
jgi:hypothetical protein